MFDRFHLFARSHDGVHGIVRSLEHLFVAPMFGKDLRNEGQDTAILNGLTLFRRQGVDQQTTSLLYKFLVGFVLHALGHKVQ